MSGEERDQWLTEALATRDLERVQPNMGAAGDRVNHARRHVRSARLLASEDPTLAIAACHDAIRKALTAHMTAAGLRPRGGEGAHRIVLHYARYRLADVITAEDLTEAEDIRRDRATELGRWRQALLGVAEGLGVLEAEAKQRASVALAGAFRARDATEDSKDFDLRKIDLGLAPDPPSGRKRARERERDMSIEVEP